MSIFLKVSLICVISISEIVSAPILKQFRIILTFCPLFKCVCYSYHCLATVFSNFVIVAIRICEITLLFQN